MFTRRIIRWVSTGLTIIFGLTFVPVANVNVEELAKDKGWDKTLTSWWPRIMDAVTAIDSAWVFAAFAFLLGATTTMWVFRFLPEVGKDQVTHSKASEEEVSNQRPQANEAAEAKTECRRATATGSVRDSTQRRQVVDAIWQTINDYCRSAYYIGHQLRNSWDRKIVSRGSTEFVRQIREFLDSTNNSIQSLDKILRRYEYMTDIDLKFRSDFKFHADLRDAATEFINAIQSLPETPDVETVRLLSPQATKFNNSIDEFNAWIQRCLRWAKDEM